MTLHPWPQNDNDNPGTGDPAAVLWTGAHGLGLFSDALTVPLRFLPEPAKLATTVAVAAAVAVMPGAPGALNSAALLRVRDLGSRFGAG